MKDILQSRAPVLDPNAAKLLMLRISLDVLESCTNQACTVREIADALGTDIRSTWYHVRKLTQAGLISEIGSRARAGRAQKIYRATATSFYVPSDLRSKTISSELTKLLDSRITFGDSAIGELFHFDGSRWRVENVYDDETSSDAKQHDRWLIARLTARQRDELEKEVKLLFEKYSREQGATGGRSIVRFACASLSSGSN